MAGLPVVGSNDGTWGTALNEFLAVGHDDDGTHTKAQMLTDMGWSPTTYTGQSKIVFPNGLIFYTRIGNMAGASSLTIDISAAGISTFVNALVTPYEPDNDPGYMYISAKSATSITVKASDANISSVHLLVIGY